MEKRENDIIPLFNFSEEKGGIVKPPINVEENEGKTSSNSETRTRFDS